MKIDKILLNKIFVTTLPIWGIILANLAVKAQFKVFCLFKLLFHHECLGCGMTRAFAALSRFEFRQAYEYNPRIVIIAPLFILIWIIMLKQAFKRNKKGSREASI